uniref:Uncharacterized protein n=1 Tax=uncultured marine virus TaxID=186617 RepID=A0A0F7L6M8_9VIRU|nr:hypothetical protein [uncultured marine virus]
MSSCSFLGPPSDDAHLLAAGGVLHARNVERHGQYLARADVDLFPALSLYDVTQSGLAQAPLHLEHARHLRGLVVFELLAQPGECALLVLYLGAPLRTTPLEPHRRMR